MTKFISIIIIYVYKIFQVLALVSFPDLIDKVDFPSDVKTKARLILEGCKGGSAGQFYILLYIFVYV